ncbi:MAG: hypothetical protein QXH12_05735 [Candidatus Caldarchaeum sp.]
MAQNPRGRGSPRRTVTYVCGFSLQTPGTAEKAPLRLEEDQELEEEDDAEKLETAVSNNIQEPASSKEEDTEQLVATPSLETPKEPLQLEEEENGENSSETIKDDAEIQETGEETKEAAFPLGGHLVVETPDAGETTRLQCVKCGKSAPLTEAEKLANTPCAEVLATTLITATQAPAAPTAKTTEKCHECGRKATKTAPFWSLIDSRIEKRVVCEQCYKDWLKLLRRGPEIRPRIFGRGRGYFFQR